MLERRDGTEKCSKKINNKCQYLPRTFSVRLNRCFFLYCYRMLSIYYEHSIPLRFWCKDVRRNWIWSISGCAVNWIRKERKALAINSCCFKIDPFRKKENFIAICACKSNRHMLVFEIKGNLVLLARNFFRSVHVREASEFFIFTFFLALKVSALKSALEVSNFLLRRSFDHPLGTQLETLGAFSFDIDNECPLTWRTLLIQRWIIDFRFPALLNSVFSNVREVQYR